MKSCVLRRGAGFYLHCDHPRIADDACYLTAALTLSEQREHGVYAATQVRRARPRDFSAAPPGAWAPRIMRHPSAARAHHSAQTTVSSVTIL